MSCSAHNEWQISQLEALVKVQGKELAEAQKTLIGLERRIADLEYGVRRVLVMSRGVR